MTKHRRRLSIVALVTLLLAGCSVGTPSASPVALGSPDALASPEATTAPSAVPSPTATNPPTLAPLPSPTPEFTDPSCPSTLDPTEPDVYAWGTTGVFYESLVVTAISRASNPTVSLTPPTNNREPRPAALIGGRESALGVDYGSRSWEGQPMITSFRATLALDGDVPIELPVRLESRDAGAWNVAIFSVPDLDASGRLDFDIEFLDPCFLVVAELSTSVRVYSGASVAGCATEEAGAFAELRDAFEAPIQVGPSQVDVRLIGWLPTGKVTSLPVIDPTPPHVGFTAATPVLTSAPGGTIRASHPDATLELRPRQSDTVIFYRRAPLLRWLGGGWIHGEEPAAPIVFRSTLVEEADGTFTFATPVEPARYAAEVLFDYDSKCSYGVAGFVVGIDVVE